LYPTPQAPMTQRVFLPQVVLHLNGKALTKKPALIGLLVLCMSYGSVSAIDMASASSTASPEGHHVSVASAITGLSFSLITDTLDTVSTSAAGTGVFISPISVYSALTLALNAAGTGSSTHEQLLTLLSAQKPIVGGFSKLASWFSSSLAHTPHELSEGQITSELGKLSQLLTAPVEEGKEGATVLMANGLFSKAKMKPEFTEAMAALLKATAHQVQGVEEINTWVSDITKGIIPQLINPGVQFDTALVNALYFKGLWVTAFKKHLTKPAPFTNAAGVKKEVPTMIGVFEKETKIQVISCSAFKAAALPYKGGEYVALAILPEGKTSVSEAIKALQDTSVKKEVSSPGKTIVHLPKFKAEFEIELSETLKEQGVKDAFTPGVADFTRIDGGGLFITQVIHKVVVDVDEEGTVAAAATAVMMNRCAAPMPVDILELHYDKPFGWVIQHLPSGTPMFIGSVLEPGAGVGKAEKEKGFFSRLWK